MSRVVGQRRCRSHKVDDGWLLKAAQDIFLARTSVLWHLHHISSCKTSKKSAQGSDVLCIRDNIQYVGPHLLCANWTGGAYPLPRRERRRGRTVQDGCWAGTDESYSRLSSWIIHRLKISSLFGSDLVATGSHKHAYCARACGSGSQCHPNECIFGSGKPRWVGILGRGVYEPGEGNGEVSLRATWKRGGRILSQQGGFQVSWEGLNRGAKGESARGMYHDI
jgi:hypothetical protein